MSRNIKKISNLPLLRTLWNNNLLIVGDLIKPLNKLSKRKGYRWFWLVVLLLLMLGSQLFGAEQAVRVVKYDQAANYQVNIKLGSTSTIVIPRGIKTFVLGNQENFRVLKPEGQVLAIFGKEAGYSTSLVVTDQDGFVYSFNIDSYPRGSNVENSTSLSVVRPLIDLDIGSNDKYDHNYAVYGVDFNGKDVAKKKVIEILPNDIWSDGNYTYLDYRERNNIPVVGVLRNKVTTPINTIVRKGILVVYGVGDLVLQAGEEIVCVKRED